MILDNWNRLQRIPGGRALFNAFLRRYVPYTGSISPEVLEMKAGFARVRIRDRRAVRNHLSSVHAAALMNLTEAATGLAFLAGLPADARGILAGFEIEYLKKARGILTAECECPVPDTNERKEYRVEGQVRDEAGDVVARAQARWLVGPKKTDA